MTTLKALRRMLTIVSPEKCSLYSFISAALSNEQIQGFFNTRFALYS